MLIVKAGTFRGPRERLGDYENWFADLLGEAGARSSVWDAAREPAPTQSPPAVLVTGSSCSAYDSAPWIAGLGEVLARWARAGVPTLGVCFGHQLLAQALGGTVEKHPAGREVGTVLIDLTDAGAEDPLFAGFPRRFAANALHGDHVPRLPSGAINLAANAMVPVQAFGWGEHVRTVQFHPEFTGEAMRAYARHNVERLDGENGPGTAERVATSSTDTPLARGVVRGFVERFVP